MHQCQLNFSIFAVKSALGLSCQHLNHTNLLVRAVFRFHLYFHVRLMLHQLGISLPHEDGFSKVEHDSEDSAYYSVCDDYGIDLAVTWMYGDWFYIADYAIFGHEVKATERSPPNRKPYTMDHYTVKTFYKKRHSKDKRICEGICLFSSYFSDPGKIKHGW